MVARYSVGDSEDQLHLYQSRDIDWKKRSQSHHLVHWRCATLYTSGFMDDVTFDLNGPYGDTWTVHPQSTTASSVAIPDRTLIFT